MTPTPRASLKRGPEEPADPIGPAYKRKLSISPSKLDQKSFQVQHPLIKIKKYTEVPQAASSACKKVFNLFEMGWVPYTTLHAAFKELLLPELLKSEILSATELLSRPRLLSIFVALRVAFEQRAQSDQASSVALASSANALNKQVQSVVASASTANAPIAPAPIAPAEAESDENMPWTLGPVVPEWEAQEAPGEGNNAHDLHDLDDLAVLGTLAGRKEEVPPPLVVRCVVQHKSGLNQTVYQESNMYQVSHYITKAYERNAIHNYGGPLFGMCAEIENVAVIAPDVHGTFVVDQDGKAESIHFDDAKLEEYLLEALESVQMALKQDGSKEAVTMLAPGTYYVADFYTTKVQKFLPLKVGNQAGKQVDRFGYQVLQALLLTCVGDRVKSWTPQTVTAVVKAWEANLANLKDYVERSEIDEKEWEAKAKKLKAKSL